MRLYLDTEFNGHGGDLISIALAGPDGDDFYAEAPPFGHYDPWVAKNVVPHLDHERAYIRPYLRFLLREYLQAREGCTIYADWPGDFEHLMKLMTGPSYKDSWMVDCRLVLLKETDPRPETPHHALSDARALRDWHERNRNN
ncbi:MAG: hypothetical protein JJ902_04175 [Roseibium sp.]|nr:hypothetical protein [Roseibium sp.]